MITDRSEYFGWTKYRRCRLLV